MRFSLCTIISVVALGKMGVEGLDCRALPEASPAPRRRRAEQKAAEDCGMLSADGQHPALQLSSQQQELLHWFQEQMLSDEGRRLLLTWCLLLALGNQLSKGLKTPRFHLRSCVCLLLSTVPQCICLMPFRIHFQALQPPEAPTATMQLWTV